MAASNVVSLAPAPHSFFFHFHHLFFFDHYIFFSRFFIPTKYGIAVEVIAGADEEYVEVMVNKSADGCTFVGGSNGAGSSLPAYGIFKGTFSNAAERLAKWVHGFPTSTATDPNTGKPFEPKFTFNESGGMTKEEVMNFLREIVLPFCHKATADNEFLLVLDGCTCHMFVEFLEELKENHIRVVFRIPHSTYVTRAAMPCVC